MSEPRACTHRAFYHWATVVKKSCRGVRLSTLALDIYSTLAMLDSPECLFSQATDAITCHPRLLDSDTIE